MKKVILIIVAAVCAILVFVAFQAYEKTKVVQETPEQLELVAQEASDPTERFSARVDRVDVVFEHFDYTKYRLTTNGLVREGELNTERGFGADPDATVYVLNWRQSEGERMYYVRLTEEPNTLYILDGNGEIVKGSALTRSSVVFSEVMAREVTGFSWVTTTRDADPVYPKTDVVLKITRSDGSSEERPIATVDGSCNVMPSDTLLALNSEQLLCYYAGFGYQFRILAAENSYVVQQKEIEEASPDYNPPIADFKTVLTINARS